MSYDLCTPKRLSISWKPKETQIMKMQDMDNQEYHEKTNYELKRVRPTI